MGFLSFVAFGYNFTPYVSTEFSPLLLLHGRGAVLPVQRYLDEPRLDLKRWPCRMLKELGLKNMKKT